jgi:hypothetical protein
LRDLGTIRYSRGRVHILNRRKLEMLACECYQATIAVFDAALNTWGRRLTAQTLRTRAAG